jgi:hypothetical protein
MIHLETNLLIGAEDETDANHLTARLALARRDFFGCSAVVWMGLHPRNRSSNAKIRSNAVDFVFKPLMQRYQHAKSIFPMFSPIR